LAGEDWQDLGSATLLPRTYLSKNAREITVLLGAEFASQLAELVAASWTGPYKSSYGHHLVYLEERIAPEATPLSYITTKVRADLIRQKSEKAADALYRQLLKRYDVVHR
jgi:parvulin-like peptidyl-prolyl isomerase